MGTIIFLSLLSLLMIVGGICMFSVYNKSNATINDRVYCLCGVALICLGLLPGVAAMGKFFEKETNEYKCIKYPQYHNIEQIIKYRDNAPIDTCYRITYKVDSSIYVNIKPSVILTKDYYVENVVIYHNDGTADTLYTIYYKNYKK